MEVDPGAWPSEIRVRAAPYAESKIVVPDVHASLALPDIYLSRGGTVAVEVRQPADGNVKEVELLPIVRDHTTGSPISAQSMPSRRESAAIQFENVHPGRYLVLAKGANALERFGAVVDVVSAETTPVHLNITPFSLRIVVSLANNPLPRARADARPLARSLGSTGADRRQRRSQSPALAGRKDPRCCACGWFLGSAHRAQYAIDGGRSVVDRRASARDPRNGGRCEEW
jgi:hypothetical protein